MTARLPVSDRFDASIKRGHQVVLSNVMGRMQAGSSVILTASEFGDLSDLAGALNHYAAQAPVPVFIQPEVPINGPRVVIDLPIDVIAAFPFRVPAGLIDGNIYGSIAEYQSPPGLWQIAANRTAGDMTGSATGTQATAAFVVGREFQAGELVYFNVRQAPDSISTRRGGFSVGGR